MCGNILCIAVAVLGVDVGWQPLSEGGVQYLIQIEPHVLEALRLGEVIQSDLPPGVDDVRGYRITVGTEQLPRELPAAGGSGLSPPRPLAAPNTLPVDPHSKPIVEQTSATVVPARADAGSQSSMQPAWNTHTSQQSSSGPPKPWMPLVLVSFVLFASLGGNAYLLWIAGEFRRRYRALLRRRTAG